MEDKLMFCKVQVLCEVLNYSGICNCVQKRGQDGTPISMTTWFIVLILVNTSSGNTVPLYRSANNCLNYQFASIIYRPTEAALIKMLKNDLGLVLASTTSCFVLGCAFTVWASIEAPHVDACGTLQQQELK